MDEKEQLETHESERRDFSELSRKRSCVWRRGSGSKRRRRRKQRQRPRKRQAPPNPAIPGYDWTKHRWAFGVDADEMHRLSALRRGLQEGKQCRASMRITSAPGSSATSHLEGEEKAHIDSQADPVNIAASGSEGEYRFANRYKDAKVEKAFFVPKLCNHCTHPACVQVCPTGATYKTEDGVVVIDHTYCIGCQYCVQACPYGARFFNESKSVTDKCTWCYHRITKGLQPACVEVCPVGARVFGDRNDKQSPISQFIRTIGSTCSDPKPAMRRMSSTSASTRT